MNFTKIDEQATDILIQLYLRGYSFADSFDIFNGDNSISILAKKIQRDITTSKRYIKYNEINSKKQYINILKEKNQVNELIEKLSYIIEQLNNKGNQSKKYKNLIIRLKNNIKEIELLTDKSYKDFIVPKDIKTCFIYKMLENDTKKQLQRKKLPETLLIIGK